MSVTAEPITTETPAPATLDNAPGYVTALPLTSGTTIAFTGGISMGLVPGEGAPYVIPDDRKVPLGLSPGGSAVVTSPPSNTPEGRRAVTGYRPLFPLIVYDVNASDEDHLDDVPEGGSFLVDAAYAPVPADNMYEYGAAPNYVGMVLGSPPAAVYRAPEDWEVVRHVDLGASGAARDRGYLRWEPSGPNGAWRWASYVTMPQRALRAARLFEQLDPDGVYDYWASLLGGALAQLQVDNHSLLDLTDPGRTPADYLQVLGATLGLPAPLTGEPEAVSRARVKSAVSRARVKGSPEAVALRLADLGYEGYVTDVWVNPDHADNFYDVADAPGAVQTAVSDAGLTLDPTSGLKGTDWVEVEHGSTRLDPDDSPDSGYYPSSRVVVHLNLRGGDPIDTGADPDTLAEIKRVVSRALAEDVLPAHVTVRAFATDTGPGTSEYF